MKDFNIWMDGPGPFFKIKKKSFCQAFKRLKQREGDNYSYNKKTICARKQTWLNNASFNIVTSSVLPLITSINFGT